VLVRAYRPEDEEATHRIRRLAFGGPREPQPHWTTGREGWRGRVAELDGRPVGYLSIHEYRQFFGGVAVPMGGIASVAVDPYARGRGVATAMLDAAIADMHEHGQSLSALYPSVPALYRSKGWEQTGLYERMILSTESLAAMPRSLGPAHLLRPAQEDDLPALHAAYLALASTVDGMLDRATPIFRLSDVLELDIVDVVPGSDGLLGYLTGERPDGPRLIVHDLVAANADIARVLVRQLASWAGQLREVSLRVVDPAVRDMVLSLPTLHDVRNHPWMLRVVDLPAAILARGWPAAELLHSFAVDIEVFDEDAPWHAGRHRILVEGGEVRCEPGGSGAVRLQAQALGPWFAGSADAAMLRRAGLLDGDPGSARLLAALAGGPRAVRMADSF
jgi:predicted acetyltransferase